MALAQTNEAAARLLKTCPQVQTSVVRFKPVGDRDQVSKLDQHGGKGGAFVGEIRDSIRAGQLEAAMHSLKDMPGEEEAPGLTIGATLKREPAEDVLILRSGLTYAEFADEKAKGLKIGTNSVRRAAYIKRLFPEADVIHFRGAVDTRLRKLDQRTPQKLTDGGQTPPADALILARAGLVRLGIADRISKIFSPDEMLPSVGQGVVALECSATNWQVREALATISDHDTQICAKAEREMLWVLNGHCNAPIAGFAQLCDENEIELRGAVISLDGSTIFEASARYEKSRAKELGRDIALELLEKGARELLEQTRPS